MEQELRQELALRQVQAFGVLAFHELTNDGRSLETIVNRLRSRGEATEWAAEQIRRIGSLLKRGS